MPRFMDVHTSMVGVTAEQLTAAHQADLDIQGDEDVDFQHAWADPRPGTCSAFPRPQRRGRPTGARARGAPRRRSARNHGDRLTPSRFMGGGASVPIKSPGAYPFRREPNSQAPVRDSHTVNALQPTRGVGGEEPAFAEPSASHKS